MVGVKWVVVKGGRDLGKDGKDLACKDLLCVDLVCTDLFSENQVHIGLVYV